MACALFWNVINCGNLILHLNDIKKTDADNKKNLKEIKKKIKFLKETQDEVRKDGLASDQKKWSVREYTKVLIMHEELDGLRSRCWAHRIFTIGDLAKKVDKLETRYTDLEKEILRHLGINEREWKRKQDEERLREILQSNRGALKNVDKNVGNVNENVLGVHNDVRSVHRGLKDAQSNLRRVQEDVMEVGVNVDDVGRNVDDVNRNVLDVRNNVGDVQNKMVNMEHQLVNTRRKLVDQAQRNRMMLQIALEKGATLSPIEQRKRGLRLLRSPQTYYKAFCYFRMAAHAGDIRSHALMAYAFMYGLGVKKNVSQAITMYGEAAKAGDCCAMVTLGKLMLDGEHVTRDTRGGLAWLRKAAKRGDSDAIEELERRRRRSNVQ